MKKLIFTIVILFSFIASPSCYELTITNTQNDKINNTYTYNLNVYSATGTYKYKLNNEESYLVFDANGDTTFYLKNNETITIYDLPESEYQIIQNINSKYNTYINNKKAYLLNSNTKEEPKVTFSNKAKINKETTKNPETDTSTNEIILLIITITITILLILLTKIKIKRYY